MEDFRRIYFVGIGGVGMSALARHFLALGMPVAGYDRSASRITDALAALGAEISFEDDARNLPPAFRDKQGVLVVWTPAMPEASPLMRHFRAQGYELAKRAQVLGWIFNQGRGIAVAGTHGKTTIATCLSHLLAQGGAPVASFMGGISANYDSNYLPCPAPHDKDCLVVAEADEFDRSFLWLSPFGAVVSAVDPDHLEVYGDLGQVVEAFQGFARQVRPEGFLLVNEKVAGLFEAQAGGPRRLTYGFGPACDFRAEQARVEQGRHRFRWVGPGAAIEDCVLGMPGRVNLENALGASAAAWLLGLDAGRIREGLASFRGVWRRFEYHLALPGLAYVDDYAHHPREIEALAESLRELHPGQRLAAVFQPHLFSRTRDLADGFAQALDRFDAVALLPVYPARETPIEGVDSRMLLRRMALEDKALVQKEELPGWLRAQQAQVFVSLGAGDIDRLVGTLREVLLERRTESPKTVSA